MRSTTLFFCLLGLAFAFATGLSAKEPQLYTCGMHPQIIQDHPGNCPICGMKLTPLRTDAAAGGILIDPETIQRMNLKTGVVTHGPVTRDIRAVGNIAYDEAGLRDITLKYDGWIEQLYVDTTAATVKAGEPLFRIYSPDLYNAELNYLVALKTDPAGALVQAARARLELFDLSDDHIAQLAKSGQAERTYTYRAPADGIVIEKPVVVGRKVKAGELIYRLASLDPVWAVAQFYDEDAPYVHAGAKVTVRTAFGPARDYAGRIELLEPQLADNTRTLMARIVLANPDGTLRPGTYVDVNLATTIATDAVLVPADAVLRTGRHNTVFIALPGGRFDPREITLGARTADDHYQVLSGLAAGEKIVTSGQFMLDSESQLREGIQKMLKAREAAAGTTTPPATAGAVPQNPADAAHAAALRPLALAAADGAAALGRDDLEAYRKAEQSINATLKTYLASLPADTRSPLARFNPLQQTASLEAARKEFEPFSTKLVDVVRTNPATLTGLHAFECPMSPVLGTGRWLQRDADIHNPFYGSAMATCGDELK